MLENKKILVLNRLWQAIHICHVRRAFSLLYQGHAFAVSQVNGNGEFETFTFSSWLHFSKQEDPYHDFIHTISVRIKIPRVILLTFFDRLPRRDAKFTRENVFRRDKHLCQYCGRRFDDKNLTLDHVIPRDLGGETTWTNIVCCCIECNLHKGNKTLKEAGMRLLRVPAKPLSRPFLTAGGVIHDEFWRRFLDHPPREIRP